MCCVERILFYNSLFLLHRFQLCFIKTFILNAENPELSCFKMISFGIGIFYTFRTTAITQI